jgi:teichuronic acid biosynthesis glycosyltransferase TuaC
MPMHDVLVYSSLYPNVFHPTHGVFVRELTRHIAGRIGPVRLVAPLNGWRNIKNIRQINTCSHFFEEAKTLDCPVFWTFPKVFKDLDGLLLYHWTKKSVNKQANHVSLIHSHYAYPESFAARMFSEKHNLPLIITVHGSDINLLAEDTARKQLIIDTLSKADAVVTVSRALFVKVVSLIGSNENVYHIPNGHDADKFFPGSKSKAKKQIRASHCDQLVVFAGRLEPVKGLPQLLKSFCQLPDNIYLAIVGDGSQKKKLKRLSAQLGINRQVMFIEAVAHETLRWYFQASDLVVLASYSEGWPTVILEAMACGKPVVSPAVGGVPEIIINEKLGVLIKNNDPMWIADGILNALSYDWDASYIQAYTQKFQWQSIAEQYVGLYHDVIAKKISEKTARVVC